MTLFQGVGVVRSAFQVPENCGTHNAVPLNLLGGEPVNTPWYPHPAKEKRNVSLVTCPSETDPDCVMDFASVAVLEQVTVRV